MKDIYASKEETEAILKKGQALYDKLSENEKQLVKLVSQYRNLPAFEGADENTVLWHVALDLLEKVKK